MAEPKSDILIDLDALAPPKVQISFQGKTIEVSPPDLTQYAHIIDFAQQLSALRKADKGLTEMGPIYGEINELLKTLIPELKDVKLTFAMTSALFKLMSEIGSPTDKAMEKLKEQGIDLKATGTKSPKVSTSPKP
jgi:hypothetical protein